MIEPSRFKLATLATCFTLAASCSSSKHLLVNSLRQHAGVSSAKVSVHFERYNGYEADTMNSVYEVCLYNQDGRTGLSTTAFRVFQSWENGNPRLRTFDGQNYSIWQAGHGLQTWSAVDPKLREYAIGEMTLWPFYLPEYFLNAVFWKPSRLIDETSDSWVVSSGKKNTLTIWISKQDSMIREVESELFYREGGKYFDRLTFEYSLLNDSSLENLSLYRISDSDTAGIQTFSADTAATMGFITQGEAAPVFRLPDQNGNMVDLTALRGKVVLLDFWAYGCGPCIRAMPDLQALSQRFDSARFEVIGMNLSRGDSESLSGFLAERGIGYSNVIIYGSSLSKEYGVNTIPMLYLLDREGRVVSIEDSAALAKLAKLERAIERLLEE